MLSQTNQVCGQFVFFRLSYFDWSDFQLFAIFRAEKLVGPWRVYVLFARFTLIYRVSVMVCQLEVFLVKDPSLFCIVWSYGNVLQWQKNALADSQRWLFIVEPTCHRQRIYINEIQTGDIFYRLGQISSGIMKCLVFSTSAWIYGVLQINRTSENRQLQALKTSAFSHLLKVNFSETYLMTRAENRVSEPPNLKTFWRSITPDPNKALAFVTRDNAPSKKTLLSLRFCGLLSCPHLSGDWSQHNKQEWNVSAATVFSVWR